MRMAIYDPAPSANEYLTKMFFGPIRSYFRDLGAPVDECADIISQKNSIVLMAGDHLSDGLILAIKNNGNRLIVFDINDSSYISSTYCVGLNIPLIDLIFKISGLPKKNETQEPSIGPDFEITTSTVKYLPDKKWEDFKALRLAGKVLPLPYVLWSPLSAENAPVKTFSQRSGKVLISGGNHFWRVILFFKIMQRGMEDAASHFATRDYFREDMQERFRYCQACRNERLSHGRALYHGHSDRSRCNSPAQWGGDEDICGGPVYDKSPFGSWNNRCPTSFFWLAKQYEKHRGPLNNQIVERVLNGSYKPHGEFVADLSSASYYADYKWLNTIYTPPRFWEAASQGTVNFYPERTDDQEYFPALIKGEHYHAFPDDFSQFEANLPEDQWDHISQSSKRLYEEWIRGTSHAISTNLLEHIRGAILERS